MNHLSINKLFNNINILLVLIILSSSTSIAYGINLQNYNYNVNGSWDERFFVSGLDNKDEGYALTVFQNKLIAGGSFEHADGFKAHCVASWNGTSWSSFGYGLDSSVYTFIEYQGDLIAGVKYDDDFGTAETLVKWNSSNWELLGGGVNGSVHAMVIYDSNLIVAGGFTVAGGISANYIAQWDGVNWAPLEAGFNNEVNALTIYNGNLIAAGHFITAGGLTVNHIAKWNGTTWDSLGSGTLNNDIFDSMYAPIYTMTVYDNNLVIGGYFARAGGVAVNNIAQWNGATWSTVGTGVENGRINVLTIYNEDLVVGGNFDSAGEIDASNIARWDGASWYPLGSGTNGRVGALSVYNNQLFVEGGFTVTGSIVTNGIASWNGSEWSKVSSQIGQGFGVSYDNYELDALCIYDGKLIAGGYFSTASEMVCNNLVAWNGTSWESLNYNYSPDSSIVRLLIEYKGDLIVPKSIIINTNPWTEAYSFVRWNGITWDSLNAGIIYDTSYPSNLYINSMVEYRNDLIVSGSFSIAGNVAVNNIARWNDTNWIALDIGENNGISALAVYNDNLIISGYFSDAGGISANHIIGWDGSSWYALGEGINGVSRAMDIYNGKLYVAYTIRDSVGAFIGSNLVTWDGNSWDTVGASLISQSIDLLEIYNGEIYIAGYSGEVGPDSSYYFISIYDESTNTWENLNAGFDDEVNDLKVYDGALYVAGDFIRAGDKASALIAKWDTDNNCCQNRGNVDGVIGVSGPIDVADVSYLIAYLWQGSALPPCEEEGNVDNNTGPSGMIDVADLSYLVSYLWQGGLPPAPCY